MEWMGIANSIINRKGKNTELESLFNESELTNIILSVLLFIMEKTLEENNECEMHHIEAFLDDLTKTYYRKNFTRVKLKELGDYIIKDILQNNGARYTFPLVNYNRKSVEEITIRLIADKIVDENNERKIIYMLTNQGYEFLFRMREVDEEIKLTIEQLKLKEYIKRRKFNSAVKQSVELITYVRQKKKDIDNFTLSIRQNIHNVDVDEYESLLRSTYLMLNEEYETMNEIENMINAAQEKLKEDTGQTDEKLLKAGNDIKEIHHNIGLVITEQRDLIINRHSLTELYMDTIKKSFEYGFEKRYDFEETILTGLERGINDLEKCLELVKPLFQPSGRKFLGIGDIYDSQIIYKETENTDSHILNLERNEDKLEEERIKDISRRYTDAVSLILTETLISGRTTLGSILDKIKSTDPGLYDRVTRDRCIFMVSLKLYDIDDLHISDFYNNARKIVLEPTGEFNIEYCLQMAGERYKEIKEISVFETRKSEKELRIEFEKTQAEMKIMERITITDFIFRAVV